MIRRLDEEYVANLARGSSEPRHEVPDISKAIDHFLASYGNIDESGKARGDLKYSSWRKYRNSLSQFADFCTRRKLSTLESLRPTDIEQFRHTRAIGQRTWKTELQTLRTLLNYCLRNHWVTVNCAAETKGPRNLIPNDVIPYTPEDEIRILAACDRIGGGRYIRQDAVYERLRAKAMILVLRHTALRISDVTKLRKDALSWDAQKSNWRMRVRTTKTGESVHLPIPSDLKLLLDTLPTPRNAPRDCPYYFWNGVSTERAVVGIAERTLGRVFRLSGVPNARAHRYRHTLATRLLGNGATYEMVADILGNTPDVVRKHYGKWSQGRQDGIDRLMIAHFRTAPDTAAATNQSHEKTRPVN